VQTGSDPNVDPAGYRGRRRIRARGPLQIDAARRFEDGRACVLITATGANAGDEAAIALGEMARAHALIQHPAVPRVARRGASFLELDCPAIADGFDLLGRVAANGMRIPFGAGDAFVVGLREAMQAAHGVTDARSGGPLCLGHLSPGNVLFDGEGRLHLVGFGHNPYAPRGSVAFDGAAPVFQAPEVATGAAPSPMGDYVALLLFTRWILPHVELPQQVSRMLRGDLRASDMELIEALQWVDTRLLGTLPSWRATLDEAIVQAERIRALLGTELDRTGWERVVAELLRAAPRPQPDAAETPPFPLTLGPDAAWFAGPDGRTVRLGRAQRRMLLALTERYARADGEPLTMWELLQAGWPGEQPTVESGANRVYVEINRMRRIGLRDAIERFEQGYRLARHVVLHRRE
jgi:hypothetical protein